MPPYQRCGEIVLLKKRQTNAFAFQCIHCPDEKLANTLKDFKSHLASKHAEIFDDEESAQTARESTLRSRVSKKQAVDASLATVKVESLDAEQLVDDPLPDAENPLFDADDPLPVAGDASVECFAPETVLDWPSSDSQSTTLEFLESCNEATDQCLKLIDLYRQCSGTWDMQDLSCRMRHVRLAAKDKLLALCRVELQIPSLDPSLLQRYTRNLRNAYQQEKMRRIQCERESGGGVAFTPRCRYYAQLRFLEPHVAPFQCDLCEQLLNSVDVYKVHRAGHDGSLPFVCPTCGRGFSRSGNCTIHLRRHTHDYQLGCEDCGKRFATTSDLQVHRRSHTGERPFCCDICGKRFSTRSFFERHKRRHDQRPRGKCHICDKSFFEQSVLNDHIKGHLNVRDKECDICHKTFTSCKYLRQHKEIHNPQKRYICKICTKGFAQYAGLSGHMKSHGRTAVLLPDPKTMLAIPSSTS
ncbi:GL14945 [Drosophila persimilis]|uniref:GL14945 n=1 Tax=Drosophila persimilis TaxID=7234 RepID=B4H079_DROPE|nr:GL14945 [Drosophila persimilis]